MNQYTLFRVRANMRQKQAAQLLGVSQQMISNLETGRRKPSDQLLHKIAKLYKCSPNDLTDAK